MNIVLLGPPGAGKGTQAERIVEDFTVAWISTGDIFRKNLREGTPLGLKAKEYMDKGELVPDELTVDLVKDRIKEPDCEKGFMLDGFPRTINQAERFDQIASQENLSLDCVLNIDVPDEELMKRLTGRRMCKKCGKAYHVMFNPPKQEGVCDPPCGGELYQRDDDKEDVIRNRLDVYYKNTQPLIDYYKNKNILVDIPGTGSVDEVYSSIKKTLS